jgi:hypothetical protein
MMSLRLPGTIVVALIALSTTGSSGDEICANCDEHNNNGEWDCTQAPYDAEGRVHEFVDVWYPTWPREGPFHPEIYCGTCGDFHPITRDVPCNGDDPPQNLAVESAINALDASALRRVIDDSPSSFIASNNGRQLATLDCRGEISRVFEIPAVMGRVALDAAP